MYDLVTNANAEVQRLSDLAFRQLPYATARALNDTAEEVVAAEKRLMAQVFDRPVPWTLNAFRVEWATVTQLVAVVSQREQAARRNYLFTQAMGGPRPLTGFERAIDARSPYLITGSLSGLVPGRDAALDAFGNWSKGQMTAVMAALRSMNDAASNTSKTSRSSERAKRARKRYRKLFLAEPRGQDAAERIGDWEAKLDRTAARGTQYFVPRPGGGLRPAIYSRDAAGDLRTILVFASQSPTYEPRFPFEAEAERVATAAFPRHMVGWLETAMATARPDRVGPPPVTL